MTLDEYVDSSITTIKRDMRTVNVDLNKTMLSGLDAYELVASGTFDMKGLQQKYCSLNIELVEKALGRNLPPIGYLLAMKYTSILTIKDGLGYVVSYAPDPLFDLLSMSNPEDSYFKYLPTVKSMVKSLEIS
jgi:hypothetical protein